MGLKKKHQLSMPQLLWGGLSENWLLKELGDIHWEQITRALNTASDALVDSRGERLYASFVRLYWSGANIRHFGENDDIELVSNLSRYGSKLFFSKTTASGSPGMLTAELMSVFSTREASDNKQLKKGSLKTSIEAQGIEEHEKLPVVAKQYLGQKTQIFDDKGKQKTESKLAVLYRQNYQIDAYDDINGVGLLYFASYPKINDKCERTYVNAHYDLEGEWLELAGPISRDIHYYGNANPDETLIYELNELEEVDGNVMLKSSLYRSDDHQLIARLYTVKELATGVILIPKSAQSKEKALSAKEPKRLSQDLIDPNQDIREETTSSGETHAQEKATIKQDKASLNAVLIQFLSSMLDIKDLQPESDLNTLGIESIAYVELSEFLLERHGLESNPGRFYGLSTVNALSDYLLGNQPASAVAIPEMITPKVATPKVISHSPKEEAIAIIGMSGRFPGSSDIHTFWENIKENKDLITEVPAERWDWRAYFGDPSTQNNKTKSKWGGFIDGIADFDPLFFGISPHEAELMDPQQRITLEAVYTALEDAGLPPTTLKGSDTGVFIGVSGSDYSFILREAKKESIGAFDSIGSSISILANRISYLLALHGPSKAVDTACSSSLVALDMAIKDIKDGTCKMAIVGGVNALLSPALTLSYSQAGMLSEDGRCKSFDDRANGYVRSEGVGIVILKALEHARRDGDRIYGIIRGSSVNHGGKANTLTSPNPEAQRALVLKAHTEANIDPREVSYLEAHGTGTALGDPIEIEALKLAFADLYQRHDLEKPVSAHCGIGSVKANIGHLEAAAGITGLIKVLLCMQHQQLPGNPHLEKTNKYIDLEGSPFYLRKETSAWEVAQGRNRIAGVSSFGIGGANAHVVLEEYTNASTDYQNPHSAIILLSAKNEARLKEQALNLRTYLQNNEGINLHDVAYTLQLGRAPMEERLAMVTNSLAELIKHLRNYLAGKTAGMLIGNIKKNKGDFLLEGEAGEAYIQTAIAKQQSKALAQLWIKGVEIDWNLLYTAGRHPRKISLPTYPFARDRYWVTASEERSSGVSNNQLHPLLHRNESDLAEQKYLSIFSGNETFLSDHQVREEKVLPGVAYLELAREAGARSLHQPITQLKDISWLSPIRVNGKATSILISLVEEGDAIGYEVYSQQEGQQEEEVIHGQGRLSTQSLTPLPATDITQIKDRLEHYKDKKACYDLFKKLGLNYGPGFQGIEALFYSDEEALSKIKLDKAEDYILQPGILDSALQTCISLDLGREGGSLSLPFSVKEVNIYGDVSQTSWCYVRKGANQKAGSKVISYDIDLLSQSGEVLLRFNHFVALPAAGFPLRADIQIQEPEQKEGSVLQLFTTDWAAQVVLDQAIPTVSNQLILLAGGSAGLAEELAETLEEEVIAIEANTEVDYYHNIQQIVQSKLKEKAGTHLTVLYRNSDYVSYAFISGLLKTAEIEDSKITGKTIGVESLSIKELEVLAGIIKLEQGDAAKEVRYIGEKREVRRIEPLSSTSTSSEIAIKEGGVYLITGGTGGLGRLFAQHLSNTKRTSLVLTGRSEKSKLTDAELKTLNASYRPCDVTDRESVKGLIEEVIQTHGKLDGIIHSAGLIKDSFLLKKTEEESAAVLGPKIQGVKHLDWATKEIDLDFTIYFSSLAGVMGNIGQADYAAANAWLDNYAHDRNTNTSGKRKGHTLSINWPLWAAGGMQVDTESKKIMERQWGMQALPSEEGIEALESLLPQKISQGIVTYGVPTAISEKWMGGKKKIISSEVPSPVDEHHLRTEVEKVVLNLASQLLKLEVSYLATDEKIGDYGFDSIMMTKFANALNDYYSIDLLPTTFYNYPTIAELSSFLVAEYAEVLNEKHPSMAHSKEEVQAIADPPALIASRLSKRKNRFVQQQPLLLTGASSRSAEPIAIIGMSARFPGAPDLTTFWKQIESGKDLITEIPADRWDWKAYYGDPQKEKGKTKAKWGGFIADIDKFDPLYFNISPQEAELMDPQQRLALQTTYHALEDAGISSQSIKGSNTGIFIGVSSNDYSILLHKYTDESSQAKYSTGSAYSVLVNRISYLLDIHGPSEPIDTACSSSLIAIHRAIENIRNGHCEMAIAGGVNAMLSPELTLSFSQAGMLSEVGRCKTFDQSASGYVRGEGVGIIVLKSLSQAIADGDQIHALIRSSSENHGGKANTLTSPNPKAQKDLLVKAYRSADIDPSTVSYIEAHGTGTPLGDPIETEGLKSAFQELYQERNLTPPASPHIKLGSVKTNIGHLESAAGIAGVLKVVLSLKHKTIPGNPHLSVPNEYLKLENSPFELQKETTAWETQGDQARIAGVSSFGFGGANAHVVLEEYVRKSTDYQSQEPAIILLSAMDEARLKEQASNLSAYLKDKEGINLQDVAYTLQLGRSPLEERLAVVARDLKELLNCLESYQAGKIEGLFLGNIKKEKQDFILSGSAGKDYVQSAIRHKQTDALAQLWVKGVSIDWHLLYEAGRQPNKISLPTYPFARERYWIPESEGIALTNQQRPLHPLLHRNESDLAEQKYLSIFSGNETFLSDHKVREEKVLPGVAYLELAREAGTRSLHQPITQLKNISWLSPIRVNGKAVSILISLFEEGDGISYEVYSQQKGPQDEALIHGRGRLSTLQLTSPPALDIAKIKDRLAHHKDKKTCYDLFKGMGLNYGPSFQGIAALFYSEEEALSEIQMDKEEEYILPPGMLDSALQTCMGLSLGQEKGRLNLPFNVKEVNIYGDVSQTSWCYARKSKNQKAGSKVISYDIDLLSQSGEVLLRFNHFVALPADSFQQRTEKKIQDHKEQAEASLQLFTTKWKTQYLLDQPKEADARQLVLLAGGSAPLAEKLTEILEEEVIAIQADTELEYYHSVQQIVQSKLKEKAKTHLTVLYSNTDYIHYGFINGLLKTAEIEHPMLRGKTIGVERLSIKEIALLADIIKAEQDDTAKEVRYIGEKREVRRIEPISSTSPSSEVTIKEGGVYLITGGAGGLGRIFAQHLSKTKETTLVLTGRSKKSKLTDAELKALNASYQACDVTDRESVKGLIEEMIQTHGKLDGIIHSAGLINDSFLLKKTEEESAAVLSPKIQGAKHLDQATKEIALDFTIYFSSLSGVMGNLGQGDYAAANAWLDNYAHDRNTSGKRKGHTLSINWPLWADGGMQLDVESEKLMERQWGMRVLPTKVGIKTFETLLQYGIAQGIVTYGMGLKLENNVLKKSIAIIPPKREIDLTGTEQETLRESTSTYLKSILSTHLKLPIHRIENMDTFEKYGIDSMMITRLNNHLNEVFEDLPSTLFFEYQTLGELIDYFLDAYPARLLELTGTSKEVAKKEELPFMASSYESSGSRRPRFSIQSKKGLGSVGAQKKEDIAIIGLSGRYPGANNIGEFWENLKAGKDSITEIPQDRWDVGAIYDPEKGKAGKSYSKWGGFMADVDKFDPLFFNISPREAELMDPQERLFLQTAWESLEDAGYTRAQLQEVRSTIGATMGGHVGVYVGVMYEEYQLFGAEESLKGNPLAIGGSPSSIANRVSYYLNIHGPSMAVDTMCSSSLTAIHLAVEAIQHGQCSMAIAGGVNVSVHPNKYKMLSQGRFVSDKGRCESFGEGGNGYVPAEGVGAVLLKPLAQAEADGDRIYGVIKGSSLNHGGKTNGYTVPNPNAQAEVIKEAIERAGVKAADFSYVEAHGTGTSLGDPIEIAGLSKAFKSNGKEGQYCALGSVKSNIGHAESAAGIAGMTKILLQFKHQKIVPSLHSKALNPNIDFEKTHFKVQQKLEDWVVDNEQARLAGISGFGAGGSNAHIIIQEYIHKSRDYQSHDPAIILLSAKNEARLKEQASNLSAYLKVNERINLHDVAYTLQEGREAMEERLAMVANSIEELIDALDNFQEGKTEGLLTGNSKKDKSDFVLNGKAGAAYLREAIENREGESLAQLWVKGVKIDWTLLYPTQRPQRISLPTYPFDRQRYWIRKSEDLKLSNVKTNIDAGNQSFQTSDFGQSSVLLYSRPSWQKADARLEAIPLSAFTNSDLFILLHPKETTIPPIIEHFPKASVLQLSYKKRENGFAGQFQKLMEKTVETLQVHLQSISKEKKVNICLLSVLQDDAILYHNGLTACFKSIQQEYDNINLKSIQISSMMLNQTDRLVSLVKRELSMKGNQVLYKDFDLRHLSVMEQLSFNETPTPFAFDAEDVFWITGGLGGIGMLMARHLLTLGVKHVIVTGRSDLTDEKKKLIQDLIAPNTTITYYKSDVTKTKSLERIIEIIKKRNLRLKGIIHSAGLIRDATFQQKSISQIREVLAPKIKGIEKLDEITKEAKDLAYFIIFSSIAGITGNHGQSDYAAANAFMDAYAQYRQDLVNKGLRNGKTVSINWPYWEEGGMKMNDHLLKMLHREFGLSPLKTNNGLKAFESILNQHYSQVVVYPVDQHALSQAWLNLLRSPDNQFNRLSVSSPNLENVSIENEKPLASNGISILALLSQETGVPINDLDLTLAIDEIGLDSILLMKLTGTIYQHYQVRIFVTELQQIKTVGDLIFYVEEQLGQTEKVTHSLKKNKVRQKAKPNKTIILLSTPRAGSTLLRVMLGKNPNIFSPPELYLLGYEDMMARGERLSKERKEFLKEGLVDTLHQLKGIDVESAKREVLRLEEEKTPISEVYKYLHHDLGGRYLVDKTPAYGGSIKTLKQAEQALDEPIYIYLSRHPLSVMTSFVKNRFDKMLGIEGDPWQLAEQVWRKWNDNILSFLQTISPKRQIHIPYEYLVNAPEEWMKFVSSQLNIDYDPQMINPYESNSQRNMTQGLHSESLMIGDPNFAKHSQIEPHLALTWKKEKNRWSSLSTETLQLAEKLGYSKKGIVQKKINTPTNVPLLPSPEGFLNRHNDDPTWHINFEITLESIVPLSQKALNKRYHQLINHHKALQTTFKKKGPNWEVNLAVTVEESVPFIDGKKLSPELLEQMKRELINTMRQQISFRSAPMMRLAVIDLGANKYCCILVIHHLIADGISGQKIIHELLSSEKLQAPNFSQANYAQELGFYQTPSFLLSLKEFWTNQTTGEFTRLNGNANIAADSYGAEETYHERFKKQTGILSWEKVAAALYQCLAQTGTKYITVAHRLNGRKLPGNIQAVDDIGYFAGDIPITLESSLSQDITIAQEQLRTKRNELPLGGISYEILANSGGVKPLSELTSIRLNYQPNFLADQKEYQILRRHVYVYQPDKHRRPYGIDCIIRESAEHLQFIIRYNKGEYNQNIIQDFVREWSSLIFTLVSKEKQLC